MRAAACTTACLVGLLVTSLAAQRVPLTLRAEGAVWIEGQRVGTFSAETSTAPVRLETRVDRASVSVGGVTLFLDASSAVRISSRGYNYPHLEVTRGSVVVVTPDDAVASVSCGNQVKLSSGGRFRFEPSSSRPSECDLRVFDGAAAVTLSTVTSVLRPGEKMAMDPACGDMIPTNRFSRGSMDAFDQWILPQLPRRGSLAGAP